MLSPVTVGNPKSWLFFAPWQVDGRCKPLSCKDAWQLKIIGKPAWRGCCERACDDITMFHYTGCKTRSSVWWWQLHRVTNGDQRETWKIHPAKISLAFNGSLH
jgi:hypothetical protein